MLHQVYLKLIQGKTQEAIEICEQSIKDELFEKWKKSELAWKELHEVKDALEKEVDDAMVIEQMTKFSQGTLPLTLPSGNQFTINDLKETPTKSSTPTSHKDQEKHPVVTDRLAELDNVPKPEKPPSSKPISVGKTEPKKKQPKQASEGEESLGKQINLPAPRVRGIGKRKPVWRERAQKAWEYHKRMTGMSDDQIAMDVGAKNFQYLRKIVTSEHSSKRTVTTAYADALASLLGQKILV